MTRPLRVLMTTDTVGGVFAYSLDLCRELASAELGITLVTLGPGPSDAQRAELARLEGCELVELGGRLEWMDEPWREVDRTGKDLLALARELGAGLVHLNGYAHAALPFGVPRLVVAHSCVLSWWRAVHGGAAPPRYDEYRRRVRAGLTAADAVVAPSAAMLRALGFEYATHFRGMVIANGADARRFAPGPKLPSLCAMGRFWDPAKNLDALAHAACDLPWPLRLIGDLQPPEEQRGAPGALHGVRALGPLSRDQVARELARCAVYAHPARYEPFGLSVLEAALSGCALVLGDIASLRELWEGAADFVACDDRAALRATLERLLADPVRCRRSAARARARAQHYSLQRFAASYRELYARLAGLGTTARRDRLNDFTHRTEAARCASSSSIIR